MPSIAASSSPLGQRRHVGEADRGEGRCREIESRVELCEGADGHHPGGPKRQFDADKHEHAERQHHQRNHLFRLAAVQQRMGQQIGDELREHDQPGSMDQKCQHIEECRKQ